MKVAIRVARALSVACVLLVASPSRAYHDEQTPSLEESAYLLRSNEWLLGPLTLGVGLWRLQLSTRVGPWIVGAALKKALPNLELAGSLVTHPRFTLTLRAALYYVNSRKLLAGEPVLHVFLTPLSLDLSTRINSKHTVSGHFEYVHVSSDEDANGEDLELHGGALANNAQVHASWEWRLSRVTALLATLRYLPFQGDPILESTVTVDPQTTADVNARLDTEDMQHAVAGSIACVFSWQNFNLRAGVAYGALFLTGPGLVLPLRFPYPELNFYWRL